jgi:SAM-dependent methyltransferase
MASLLAYNGAEVLGADLEGTDLSSASKEADRWGVADRVNLITYSGRPEDLPSGPFDAVFSKSVLVVVPNLDKFFGALADRLVPGGMLVCVENQRGGVAMKVLRKLRGHDWAERDEFSGVGPEFLASLRQSFPDARVIRSSPLVCAIAAPAPRS